MIDPFSDVVFVSAAVGGPGGGWDTIQVEQVLRALSDFVAATIAPTNAVGDREGCRIVDHRVLLPRAMVEAYAGYIAQGWHLLALPEARGGIGAPHLVGVAATEMLTAGNHAFQMLVGLVPGAIAVIEQFGSAAQKDRLVPPLVAGTALATMCLTEGGAGSDLGSIITKGVAKAEGGWALTGEKIFISGGDQNLSQSITHLVLARTGGVGDGVKGLSLFVCPSHRDDATRNAVDVVRIEDKLGLHASPTCQLRFSDAQAQLLGQEGEGLKAMFVMMNHARLDVSAQGIAHAAKACALAQDYADARIQGGKPIAQHGDVARMLLEMDATTLGARAMAYRAALLLDDTELAAFLTPVCKAFCTDAASRVADLGIQVMGGYGYLPEFGMEQIWRDSRVTRLYEGTNGVLAMTLVRRLLGGAAEVAFEREVEAALALAPSTIAREGVAQVLAAWCAARSAVVAAPDKGMVATSFMQLTGLLWFAACWLRLEQSSGHANQPQRIVRLAKFVRAALLPEAVSLQIRCQAMADADEETN